MRFPGAKLYRKIRYRKGFGVHSPFVYNLITKVIEEKASYYAFEEIEYLRNTLLLRKDLFGKITEKETQSPRYGAFLFRLMNFLKCESVVQIGCSTGVMSLYLSMVAPSKTTSYLLEERVGLLQFVRDFSVAHNLGNIHILEGDYKESIKKISGERKDINLIFINQFPKTMTSEEMLFLCSPLIGENTVIVLNDILKNKHIKEFWLKIKENSHTRISLDLYQIGIVSFCKKHPKKHYKAYFSYGKKQNIHKNRRRRLYIFSRRKKSIKNKSPHRSLRNS
ncbi:hypothetical protein LJB92_03380 [Bacteroidales bacterium OttesenSCG-928-M06]|nr:hypothetical protein [Bacteroidales bacterium OttesenSCG-928-M06]